MLEAQDQVVEEQVAVEDDEVTLDITFVLHVQLRTASGCHPLVACSCTYKPSDDENNYFHKTVRRPFEISCRQYPSVSMFVCPSLSPLFPDNSFYGLQAIKLKLGIWQ